MNSLFDFDLKLKKGYIGALDLELSSYDYIIGADEAGRGPGAGGVFGGAVCFKNGVNIKDFEKLNDSKKLSEKTRNKLFSKIKEQAHWGITCIEVEEIEKINILQASLLAMKKSICQVIKELGDIHNKKILILIDGNKEIDFQENFVVKSIIKGDSKSASIAAASILAKVSRDSYMTELDKKYPKYNFKKNKGYLTKEHIETIKKEGICRIHRKSFLKNILN